MIEEMIAVTAETVQAFERLMPQLTKGVQSPSRTDLEVMAASGDTFVFLARDPENDDEIIGSATLAIELSPTGRHGWIEDVVVDQAARGKGWGRALTQACLDRAHEIGLHQVNLTSRPSRVAANNLYQSMGFVRRETNAYRHNLDEME
jgi:ribosomal protein S18 acetylase RimI-like enzyme